MKKKIIKIPLYRGLFIILISNSIDEINKLFPSFVDDDLYAHASMDYYRDEEAYIMVLNFNDSRPITNAVIAHEAFHLANFLADRRGIMRDNNDEPLAYLIEWMVEETHKFIDKCELKLVNL